MLRNHQKCNSPAVRWICVFCLAAMLVVWAIWLLNAHNVCTLTHQSELVQGLLESTSQLGDMPGLQIAKHGASTQSDIDMGIGETFSFIWLYHWCQGSARLGMWMSGHIRPHLCHWICLCNSNGAKHKKTILSLTSCKNIEGWLT